MQLRVDAGGYLKWYAYQLESFRETRRNLEASILPLATSVDGRRFSFQASLHGLPFQVGGYVVLDDGSVPRLGQVNSLDLDQLSTELTLPAGGGGTQGTGPRWRSATPGARAPYSKATSQLLLETDLRLVILDPNSDFVRLGQVRSAADPALAERYERAAREVVVYSADSPGERRLRLHATEIDPATQAAVLRLDPIDDREEFATLADLLASGNTRSFEDLEKDHSPEAHRLTQLVAKTAEHAIRIAAEGRKFGLYLLVSTQRPQKIAENVLSQADNLVLLRLNSLADTAFTQATFSFVPPSLIDRAVTFHQGGGPDRGKDLAAARSAPLRPADHRGRRQRRRPQHHVT